MAALIPLVLMLGLTWLLLVRPQQQRVRRHAELVQTLAPGDEIITAGGVYATLREIGEQDAQIEVAPGVTMRILKGAISRKVEPEVG